MFFRLSPITQQRLRRFRRNRRAWTAFWLMVMLGFLALIPELLCNAKPLFLRVDGRAYFPLWRYYPQDIFLHNGQLTAMDYRTFARSDVFDQERKNIVLMAPVPYGPNEVLGTEGFEQYRLTTITATPLIETGRLNLSANGIISRSEGCDPFFPGGLERDTVFTDHWVINEALTNGLKQRFENRRAPALEVVLNHRDHLEKKVIVSLTPYEPRAAAPVTLRLTLKPDIIGDSLRTQSWRIGIKHKELERIPKEIRAQAEELLNEVTTGKTFADKMCETAQGKVRLSVMRADVSWPHRPVPGHWMGVDAAGRDVFARVLYGLRSSLLFGMLLTGWAMLLGLLIGALQGYFGGWVDISMQRLIEIWSALPFLYVMILVGSVAGRSFALLLFCYGLFNWIGLSYYLRAEFLRLRKLPFVEAARCQGLSHWQIIFHHILPNALTPAITLLPFSLVGAIASLSALDFLGFGLPPLAPSWGELLQQAQHNRSAWWLVFFPSAALFLVMFLSVLIGEGLRDAFDPKPGGQIK